MGVRWKAWIALARQNWGTQFPRCESRNCRRPARVWMRLPFRRGIWLHESWYCSEPCFEAAVGEHFMRVRLPVHTRRAVQHRIPLGLLMLSRGQVTDLQLRAALEAQRKHGGRLGYWMETMGFATEAQLTAALGLQWACPVLPAFEGDSRCAAMLPFHLQKSFRMLPVQFVAATGILHVAFSEDIDYTALYASEQILRCRTRACLLPHGIMERTLERVGRECRNGEILFPGKRDVTEMAHITCSYALKLEGCEVRVAACGAYVWVRLESSRDSTDLLFQRPCSTIASAAG